MKFVHLRYHDQDGKVLSHGGATIAYEQENNDVGIVVYYATARCNIKDLFCKKTARAKAGGKLRSNAVKYVEAVDMPLDATATEVVGKVIEEFRASIASQYQDTIERLY